MLKSKIKIIFWYTIMVRIKMRRLFSFIRMCRPLLRGVDLDSARDSNVIAGGDLNCALDPTLDKRGDILIPRQHVIKSIESFQNELNLHDIWRIKNSNTLSYTWSKMLTFHFLQTWLLAYFGQFKWFSHTSWYCSLN